MKSMIRSRLCFLFIAIISIAAEARCQLFEQDYPSLDEFRSLGISTTVQNFEPSGGNTLADSAKIRIKTPLWLAEYRQMGLRVAFGYSSYKFNNNSRSEISLAAESMTDIALTTGSRRGNFFLPIVISTNFVEASGASNSSKDFNIADVGIGTGMKYEQLGENFGIQLTGVGIIYYSTPGFSVESGSSTALEAELQFLFRDIIGDGMTAGYRFEFQKWSMSDKTQNYSRQFQGPYVGIFF
ncbi:MAG: hypothetical protein WBZ48_10920 [Bacteroidota bacterium]